MNVPVSCIGLTGQMHGVLYVDSHGNAVSPLYTWQDESGSQLVPSTGEPYAQLAGRLVGEALSSGYGIVTHFVKMRKGLVPENASHICTIGDYVAARLCGKARVPMHPTNAGSLGLYDAVRRGFNLEKLEALGIHPSILPEIAADFGIAGHTHHGIPVSVAIGDNQASVAGSLQDSERQILVNLGTGGQISMVAHSEDGGAAVSSKEIRPGSLRPYFEGTFLLAGSTLCGGHAYAILERFFRGIVEMAIGGPVDPLYPKMEQCVLDAFSKDVSPGNSHQQEELSVQQEVRSVQQEPLFAQHEELSVNTQFSGSRENPGQHGGIFNITEQNFTARNIILATLEGIAEELCCAYKALACHLDHAPSQLIASGNGIRKNEAMQRVMQKKFGLPLLICRHDEEASYGAALFASVCAKCFTSLKQAQSIIRYK
jgi:sedoheptulokinase